MGQVRAFVPYLATGTDYALCFVFTSSEYFSPSAWLCVSGAVASGRLAAANFDIAVTGTEGLGAMLNRNFYGSIWNAWAYKETEAAASTYLLAQDSDHVMIVGTFQGKGTVSRMKIETAKTDLVLNIDAGTPLTAETTNITTKQATVANQNSDIIYIDPPTNGMAQFKGLTTTANQKLYLQVICLGVAPVYSTWAKSATSGDDALSFIVNCYTGIPQCGVKLTTGYSSLNSTHADVSQTTNCLADPRYLTWRSFLLQMAYDGTVSWFRVDSYWNSAAKAAASTWGPGIILSVNYLSSGAGDDNDGTTDLGKTFIFSYHDGSGVQLNHVDTGTTPHASN
jgi:hypothetical protein